MNLGLTDDQLFFQETTRKFLEQEAPLTTVRALADAADGFDRAWWARGAELGWASFLVPEDDGGGSLSGEGAHRGERRLLLEEFSSGLLEELLVVGEAEVHRRRA